ncbi:FHA domain-containing protein [Cohnella ginsengisoli]|uniref:FHA domain-containing protein n=1 Tax=Cohnella ginsengisoli TaxID=425004 RepID=A0A9X4KPC5_9BACL|nr:FHA domain-containing protein [Cohnella ginsengisoli]MDG0793772.1 FHA domain-containing protein [Cohnella ginsengisoli]
MNPIPCLVVVRGYPYDEGAVLTLKQPNAILGRRDAEWNPDIGFDNAYVSRKHAEIACENGICKLTDFGSKHGTEVNGLRLTPFQPAVLRASDIVTFSKGTVCLAFSDRGWEETMELELELGLEASISSADLADVALDPIRQVLTVRDSTFPFTDKEFKCVELLLRRERRFVAKEEIARYVWPERTGEDGSPAAGAEEINSLLYRIRKKTGPVLAIENIRGKGFVLSLSSLAEKFV